mgnify:FL=1
MRARTGFQRARSGGFSLIEILVAVLIVSVGVLGVAGLQLVSLQNNTSAMYRTQAFQAAYEIIDRARANPGQDYSQALADAAPGGADCIANACTPAQMRDYDLTTWLDDLAATLPNGDGEVQIVGANPASVQVLVQWQDERNPAAQPLSVTVSTTM